MGFTERVSIRSVCSGNFGAEMYHLPGFALAMWGEEAYNARHESSCTPPP